MRKPALPRQEPAKGKRTPEETRTRILDAALALFNDLSTLAVSTNMVAEEAGLSVGNLYYHFKNREEIVRALFERNAAETLVAFRPEEGKPISMETLETMVRRNYEILWRYRFLYRELTVLLNRDPVLAKMFLEHREYGLASFHQLRSAFESMGILRPCTKEEGERLAILVWLVSEYYLPYLEASGEVDGTAFIESGIALLKQTLAPFAAGGQ